MLVDVHARLLSYLEDALPAVQMWAGVTYPRDGYEPADGPGIAFRVRGGDMAEEGDHATPSMQFKVYGKDPLQAWQTYMALDEALTAPADGYVRWAVMDAGMGQPFQEPDTGWDFVLAYYRVQIRNES